MEHVTTQTLSFFQKTRLFITVNSHQPVIDPYPAPDWSTPHFHAVFLQGNQHVSRKGKKRKGLKI
jgi:hypothetical protein